MGRSLSLTCALESPERLVAFLLDAHFFAARAEGREELVRAGRRLFALLARAKVAGGPGRPREGEGEGRRKDEAPQHCLSVCLLVRTPRAKKTKQVKSERATHACACFLFLSKGELM